MIHIAEAASLSNGHEAKQQLVDNPRRHWIKKAMNVWNSDMELEKIYSDCDRSLCSPGSEERRHCQFVMNVANQGSLAQFPNISIVPGIEGTWDSSLNVKDNPWPFIQVSSVLEIATPQIIADNGKEYDAFDFQGDNPGVEPYVSQSLDSSQSHLKHMLRDHPAIASEHSVCAAYQDEPPTFISANTDRIWPGNQYNHGDPSKTLQPPGMECLFSSQVFRPLPSVAFDPSSSYGYNFQPSGACTTSSLHGSSRLAQSPCALSSEVTQPHCTDIDSNWPTNQFYPIAYSDFDVSTTGSMSHINETPYLSSTIPTELQDCDFQNAFYWCLHEEIRDAEFERGSHPSAGCISPR